MTISRRTFIAGAISTGYAVAAAPVLADAIQTDRIGLRDGTVSIPTKDGSVPAYYARPEGTGKYPVVLVIHEIFGVHEHIQDVCRRYAKAGYLAIAPELFVRQGDVRQYKAIPDLLQNIVLKAPDAQVNGDLDSTLAYARQHLSGDPKRAGAVGFCWGGRAVWEYAYHNPSLTAGLAYYGRVEGMKADIRPLDPIDIGDKIKVPVLGLYAEMDNGISLESVAKMQAALNESGSGSKIVVFPGVGHAFNADYRTSYNREAAEKAWTLGLAWFKQHGL
jgi:carboxymethylenebutenolidase